MLHTTIFWLILYWSGMLRKLLPILWLPFKDAYMQLLIDNTLKGKQRIGSNFRSFQLLILAVQQVIDNCLQAFFIGSCLWLVAYYHFITAIMRSGKLSELQPILWLSFKNSYRLLSINCCILPFFGCYYEERKAKRIVTSSLHSL